MDMQNVSNLQIPEGIVRTIHDKNNRLLWGRVAYDTKYAGDTVQDGTPTPDTPVPVQTVTGEQTVTISDGVNSQSYPITLAKNLFDISTFVMGGMSSGHLTSSDYRITNITNPLEIEPGTKYTFSVALGDSVKGFRFGIHQLDEDKRFIVDSGWIQLVPNSYTLTTRSNAKYIGIVCSCSTTSTTVSTGSTESLASYSAPSEWLRGTQMSINNIDADIELTKIDTYQDYIYPSNGDWYVHKANTKLVLKGTEDWLYSSSSVQPFRLQLSDATPLAPNQNTPPSIYVDYYAPYAWDVVTKPNYGVTVSTADQTAAKRLAFRNIDATSLAEWKTWLNSNNTTTYYPLATPTDTQITDATLISQLDAIHEWMTRYGYNAIVSGNLPIIIDRTNL